MALKPTLSEDEIIRRGDAIKRFLDDTDVQAVLRDLEVVYFDHWRSATDPQDRETLWSTVRALGNLKEALQGTVDAGLHYAHAQLAREKAANQH